MKWAPLEADGWRQRGDGWYAHPSYEGTLRSEDGRWWSGADVAEGRVEMTPFGPRRAPGWFVDPNGRWVQETPDPVEELTERLHRDFGRRR